jgi:hypothetical protein
MMKTTVLWKLGSWRSASDMRKYPASHLGISWFSLLLSVSKSAPEVEYNDDSGEARWMPRAAAAALTSSLPAV